MTQTVELSGDLLKPEHLARSNSHMIPLVPSASGTWFHRDLSREMEWEVCLLESLRLTSRNQGKHLLDASGLALYGKQVDELLAWILKDATLHEHLSRRGFEVTGTERKLLRHSTEYACLTLLSRSDPAGVIRERMSEACTSCPAWLDAVPVALDDQSRYWLMSHVMWLVGCWMLDDVIDSNLNVEPRIYTTTSQTLVELWDPLFLHEDMHGARHEKLDELRSLWQSHGATDRDAHLVSTGMFALVMCHENLARAGFSSNESRLVCDWTAGYLESHVGVREALHSLADSRCSFEQFVEARRPNTAVDLPILFLLLWYGRSLGISPERVCNIARQLHPTQGNYRAWVWDAMILSGIGNDLVDVRRDRQENSMNTVLCVYGEMCGKNPFGAEGLEETGLRSAYQNVAARLNQMLDVLALDLRRERLALAQGKSALFQTQAEMLAASAALVDICFATIYAGFVCPRYRDGAVELVDALAAC